MPDDNFEPRLADERVGFYSARITDLSTYDSYPARDVINKWRLVKKDPEAELSEPVEPIVFSRSDSVKAFLVKYYLGHVLDFKPIDQRLCLAYRQICQLASLNFEYAQAQHIKQVSQDQQKLLDTHKQKILVMTL